MLKVPSFYRENTNNTHKEIDTRAVVGLLTRSIVIESMGKEDRKVV